MTRDELADLLLSAAHSRADEHGVTLGEGADVNIAQFAARAAGVILGAAGKVEPEHPGVVEAEAAFRRLIDEMVVASAEIEGYRSLRGPIIGEQTLSRALSKLCPLFPIC